MPTTHDHPLPAPKQGRPPTYNWDRILDGTHRTYHHPTDYTCTTANFARQVRAEAKRRGIRVHVRPNHRTGTVAVQAKR